jgi:ferredoxin
MRVVVDRDRCEGNAVCVRIAPEVFKLDDDEYAMITADPVPVAQATLVQQAIAECPRAALSRTDDELAATDTD